MSALEQEIITRFERLDSEGKQRLLAYFMREEEQQTFDYAAWWAKVDSLQADLRARLGAGVTTNVMSLLDELRE